VEGPDEEISHEQEIPGLPFSGVLFFNSLGDRVFTISQRFSSAVAEPVPELAVGNSNA